MSERNTVKRAPESASSSPNANRCSSFETPIYAQAASAACSHNRLPQGSATSALGRVFPLRETKERDAPVYLLRRHFAVNFNEGTARSRRSLRAPDQALESKDERVHLWRT